MVQLNAGNAATGALSGAFVGSGFGPLGTIAGGVLGGIGSLFSNKKKKKGKKVSTLDPTQQLIYNDYVKSLRGGGGPFDDLFKFDANQANDVFNKNVGRPAYREFEENIVPQITGQYRSNNLMNSSYSGEALSKAGRQVQEGLDAKRAELVFRGQNEASNRRQSALDEILRMQTFAHQVPEQGMNPIDDILSTVGPKAGEWFANYLNSRAGGQQPPQE